MRCFIFFFAFLIKQSKIYVAVATLGGRCNVFSFVRTVRTSLGPLAAHTHVLRVPSLLALIILDLSNATARTMPSWPLRVMLHSPVVRSVTAMT